MQALKRKQMWHDFTLDDEELKSIHKKITNNYHWSEHILTKSDADNSTGKVIEDHDYYTQQISTIRKLDIHQKFKSFESSSTNTAIDVNFEDLDVRNCIEIDFEKSVQMKMNAGIKLLKKSIINDDQVKFSTEKKNVQNIFETKDNKISERSDAEMKQNLVKEKGFSHFEVDMQNYDDVTFRDNKVSEFTQDDARYDMKIDHNKITNNIILNYDFEKIKTVTIEKSNHRNSLSSSVTDDSGIGSLDSLSFENECSHSSFASTSDLPHDEYYCTVIKEIDRPVQIYENNSKLNVLNAEFMEVVTDTLKDNSTSLNKKVPSRKKKITRSREVLVSEESPVIEGEFEESRRVTRQLVKTNIETPVKKKVDNIPGKIVWGYFRTAWWPALIIRAEDVGMIITPGRIWVVWIGEARISELYEKNVQPFSNNFETRLDSLITNSKTKLTCKKQKDDACFATIQLLKTHFNGSALVRPYSSWIKTNISSHKDKLNDLCFFPYPDHIAEKLNYLKKVNFAKTEKYLHDKEKERLKKETGSKTVPKKVEKIEKPIEKGGINIMNQKPGMIVCAKIPGCSLWPCVIMDYNHLNKKQPGVAKQWVMWYGDFKISQVEYHDIFTYPVGIEKMENKINTTKDDFFVKALLQSTQDYCERLEHPTNDLTRDDVLHLFLKSRHKQKLLNASLMQLDPENLYPQTIKEQLQYHAAREPVDMERKRRILQSKKLKSVLSRDLPFNSLCITCFQSDGKLEEHPFFHASLCTNCLEDFRPKVFAYGNDGNCFYCTLCADEDSIAVCDNLSCPRVFCIACINYIICPNFCEKVLLKHPWNCFICEPDAPELKDSLLKIRDDWKNRLVLLYRINCDDLSPSNLERFDPNRKMRIISLFDGIGTGLQVLKNLKINVDRYYASEIDPDAIQVSFFNHGNEIVHLGRVEDIDEKKIKEIVPIDLLIGGSPCNELSLANPKRRGLDDPEGTGVLFYDYVRIKKLLEKYNKKRHLFWLFENVASMPKKFRSQISEHLGREPTFLDSADFSAMHRPRLYWGNLPWGPYEVRHVVLQDVLREKCDRQALVKKIMTVTTRSNSLNQTKQNLKPVLMNGKTDSLWITELEEIFGFPMHYTDANLQKTRRLQLIGKAWSVQTLMAILRSMFYF